MKNDLDERVATIEKSNARLRKLLVGQNIVWALAVAVLIGSGALAGSKNASFDSITAKTIAVVDSNGVVRARLSGDLPNGRTFGGHIAKRGSKAAGLIIYDEQGLERGGYVTQDNGSNAMLTLDSKYRQSALFVAGPSNGQASALRLWTKGSSIELRSDSNGSRLTADDASGVVLQEPAIKSLTLPTCSEYKDLEKKYPGACHSRFSAAACRNCLQGK